ncbi:MAG: ABC transporter permease subunit [Alphaproteobacteria bacterium]|nr:ABC transporter permease subunit [Alphaproteobacteria bacterium]
MAAYIVRRLIFMLITLFGIILLNFALVQFMPGGPVEQMVSKLSGKTGGGFGGGSDTSGSISAGISNPSQAGQGLPPELIKELEALYGFDKPLHERFILTVKQFATFQFGDSYYRDANVTTLIIERLPTTMALGLTTLFFTYLISIPLGIRKAVSDGNRFDIWTSVAIIVGYAIPSFVLAVFLMVLFAGGNYLDWFPLQGLTSQNFEELSFFGKFADLAHHLALPVLSMLIGSFATITMLTKNAFIEEIGKQYVTTARAKGLKENRILYGHVFRNAMLVVVANFPAAFVGAIFTGAILIEIIFGLNGMGLLAFEAAINRDFPLILGLIFIFGMVSLITKLLGDLLYVAIDPRIDFEARDV